MVNDEGHVGTGEGLVLFVYHVHAYMLTTFVIGNMNICLDLGRG